MKTRLNSTNGTKIVTLLRTYGEGEWWFDSANQKFHRIRGEKISADTMEVSDAFNVMLSVFRRMEREREMMLKMLPHYDPNESIWVVHHSEIEHCFDTLYPGCAEPLTDAEVEAIIADYKKRISYQLEDWEGLMREAIKYMTPREMEIKSTERVSCQD